MEFGDAPGDGQPQAGTGTLALIQPGETAECAFAIFQGNAGPLIADGYCEPPVLFNQARAHLGTWRAVLNGVGQQRAHHGSDEGAVARSEEHTSELQSRENLVCRLLLEKKKRRRELP